MRGTRAAIVKRAGIVLAVVAPLVVAAAVTGVVLAGNVGLASCLTGTWQAHSHVTTLVTDGRTITNTVIGLRAEYREHELRLDYERALARFDGELVEMSGTVTYDYRLDGSTISYTNGLLQDGSGSSREQDYTERAQCSRDALTLTGSERHQDTRVEWTIKLLRE